MLVQRESTESDHVVLHMGVGTIVSGKSVIAEGGPCLSLEIGMLLVQPVPMFAPFFCTVLVVLEGKTQHVGHALLLEVDQVCLSHPEPVSLPCFAMNSFSLTLTLARSPANTFAMYRRTSSLVKVRVGDASACWDLDFLGHALHRVGASFFFALSLSLSFGRAMGRRETPPARAPSGAPDMCGGLAENTHSTKATFAR